MDNKQEYDFGPINVDKNTLPEKLTSDSNEYLFPLHKDMLSIIFESLQEYKDRTTLDDERILIKEFFKSIECIGEANLMGKISGYYLISNYKNNRWSDSKELRLEIKINKGLK